MDEPVREQRRAPGAWSIRPAGIDDAAGLSAVAGRIFYDTFASSNTASDMDLYCSEAFTPRALAAELGDEHTDFIVAQHEGALIAFAQLHRGDAPPAVAGSAPIELKRFYVLAAWHGSGLAVEMIGAVAARARAHGAATLWLGVWEHNLRAIRFYRKLGFVEVGEQPFLLGTDLQRDLIMTAPIDRLPGPGLD